MGPRIVLHTGKGGVGRTSIAAATARRAAQQGARTLLLSVDPAGGLADVLGVPVAAAPAPVAERLWAEQVETQAELERSWSAVRAWLAGRPGRAGAGRIAAEELAVPPGVDALVGLLRLHRAAAEPDFEVVVVDCPPAGETARLLSLPDLARWWVGRVAPAGEGMLDSARPFARAVLDMAVPGDDALSGAGALVQGLLGMSDVLHDSERVSVRVVATADRAATQAARRALTYLHLHGLPVDAVVVNAVLPAEAGPYVAARRERQQAELRELTGAVAPMPVLHAPFFAEDVAGLDMLDRLADAAFAGREAAAVLHEGPAERLEVAEDAARLRLPLPLASRDAIALQQVGHELVVRVDGHKRNVLLPPALRGWTARGATFAEGALLVDLEAPAG